jgi:two-component system response regulator NreC
LSIRILIADDHGVLRAGLYALLNAEPDLEVVGEAADGHEALRRAGELQPDVVLLDISMPGLNGIEVAGRLREMLPSTHVLVLTIHTDGDILREAIKVGVRGYIIKMATHPELLDAIRTIARGDSYIHPALAPAVVQALSSDPSAESLTSRETEVLGFVAQGCTSSQIAEMLNISERTVKFHRTNLMRKLGVRNLAELVRYTAGRHRLE